MKVILTQELKGKGGEGDVVEVARGFAVNYLLPNGLAIQATPGNLKQLEARKHKIAERELARTTDASKIFEGLNEKTVKVYAKVGDEGQLFGSVTTAMIAEAVKEQYGVDMDKKRYDLTSGIKTAGEHAVTLSIYRDVKATMTVLVLDENAVEEPAAEEAPAEEVAEEVAAVEEAPAEETAE
jgi:large subunit ribosomal protein L9